MGIKILTKRYFYGILFHVKNQDGLAILIHLLKRGKGG